MSSRTSGGWKREGLEEHLRKHFHISTYEELVITRASFSSVVNGEHLLATSGDTPLLLSIVSVTVIPKAGRGSKEKD